MTLLVCDQVRKRREAAEECQNCNSTSMLLRVLSVAMLAERRAFNHVLDNRCTFAVSSATFDALS